MNILQEADKLTSGVRNKEYGHPKQFYADVAKIWSILLNLNIPEDRIADLMIAYKLVRTKQGYKRDNYVDISGYSRTREMQYDKIKKLSKRKQYETTNT